MYNLLFARKFNLASLIALVVMTAGVTNLLFNDHVTAGAIVVLVSAVAAALAMTLDRRPDDVDDEPGTPPVTIPGTTTVALPIEWENAFKLPPALPPSEWMPAQRGAL